MPELRNVRGSEAIRALERAGGVTRKGKGDHVNVKMPNGQLISIPGTREILKVGLLKAVIKKARLTETQFIRFLEG